MKMCMFTFRKNHEVFWPVVMLYTINVVDDFFWMWQEISSEFFLHNESVFHYVSISIFKWMAMANYFYVSFLNKTFTLKVFEFLFMKNSRDTFPRAKLASFIPFLKRSIQTFIENFVTTTTFFIENFHNIIVSEM